MMNMTAYQRVVFRVMGDYGLDGRVYPMESGEYEYSIYNTDGDCIANGAEPTQFAAAEAVLKEVPPEALAEARAQFLKHGTPLRENQTHVAVIRIAVRAPTVDEANEILTNGMHALIESGSGVLDWEHLDYDVAGSPEDLFSPINLPDEYDPDEHSLSDYMED